MNPEAFIGKWEIRVAVFFVGLYLAIKVVLWVKELRQKAKAKDMTDAQASVDKDLRRALERAEHAEALADGLRNRVDYHEEEIERCKAESEKIKAESEETKEELKKMTKLYLKVQGRLELLEKEQGLEFDEKGNCYHKT